MKKTASRKTSALTLHQLLGAISFWGTAARALLFGFIALMVFGFELSETAGAALDSQAMTLIYVLASFVLLDFGYVMVARAYQLQKALDLLVLCAADIFLALLYVLPRLVVNPDVRLVTDPLMYVVFVPIVVLSLRTLIGLLMGGKR